ncbi:MAG: phage head closure protein [Albidovulum sp.]
MRRPSAGDLGERVTFQRRIEASDGYGNTVSTWQDEFSTRARMMPKMGSESVIASRLQGVQPYILTVRSNRYTKDVTPAWRVLWGGDEFNIKTAANVDERGEFIEMMVVKGGATG